MATLATQMSERRRFMKLVGGTVVVGSGTVASPAVADGDGRDEGGDRSLDEAFAWDVNRDMRLTNRMQLDGDPAGAGRENVLHITSNGDVSPDYSSSAVDVRDESLTLGDVSDPGTLTYDYYKGRQATYRVPDECFLILRTTDGTLHVTYRKADTEQTEMWHTRDVSSEFPDDGWRATEVATEDVDEGGERITTTSDAIGDQILDLRRQEPFADLLGRFGGDATLLAVAIGNGSVDGVVSDAYFHNLQLREQSYVLPAMLHLDLDVTSTDERSTVTLTFANPAGAEEGIAVTDIDAGTVRMASYTPFSPPFPGSNEYENAVAAQTVRSADGGITVEFDADQVSTLLDGRTNTVSVFGAFDVPQPYTFVAIGEASDTKSS